MNSLIIGNNVIHLAEVDSTNRFATDYIRHSVVPEGTVIYADAQIAGRGQMGTKWQSIPGQSLTFSVILYPKFLTVRQQFFLNMAISLGTYRFLEALHVPQNTIKWPNDVYVGHRKLGGILIETAVKGQFLQSAVVGIGLNIFQTSFPPELPNPIALAQVIRPSELSVLFSQLCHQLDKAYQQLRQGAFHALQTEYEQALLGKGQWLYFEENGSRFQAQVLGVNERGQLNLQLLDHSIISVDFKQVHWVLE